MSIQEWEGQVVNFGRLHWRRSIWFGEWFQRPLLLSVWAGVQYWLELGMGFIMGKARRWEISMR